MDFTNEINTLESEKLRLEEMLKRNNDRLQLLKEASTEPSSDGYRRFFKLKGYSLLYTGGERLNHERFIFNCTLVSTAGHLSRKYWNVEELSKKLEGAAKQHSEESYISDYFQACYKDAFMECAKWMQEEFLKDLWHPVSEEPKKGRVFLYKTIFKGYGLNKIIDGNEWKYIIKYKKATQWLYIDDLLPKKGD